MFYIIAEFPSNGPTNYSGTQVNVYGVNPAMVPGIMSGNINPTMMMGGGVTYPDKHKQLGYMTDQMIKVSCGVCL